MLTVNLISPFFGDAMFLAYVKKIVPVMLAVLVIMLWAKSLFVLAACPRTTPHTQACITDGITICIDSTDQETCIANKEHVNESGFFGCRATEANTECLDGMPSDLSLCYVLKRCKWSEDGGGCTRGPSTAAAEHKIRKIASDCIEL